jgi:Uma2 family endonuclease
MAQKVEPRPAEHPELYLSHEDALREVEDGEVMELRETGKYAAKVARFLFAALSEYLAGRRLGWVEHETAFILDVERDLRRRPDLAFISFDCWPADRVVSEEDEGDWEIVPDLPIEVVSPHDTHGKLMRKVRKYSRYGVRQVWVLNPGERTVSVYSSPKAVAILGPDDELDGGDVLPGFRVPVATLFRRTVV